MVQRGIFGRRGTARWSDQASSLAVCVLVVLALTTACGQDTAPPDPPPGDPTFSAIHNQILERTCALGSCHGGAAPAAKLDFHLVSADDTIKICYALRRPSCLFPGSKLLVVPGKPELSFLLDKLHGTGLDGTPDPGCANTNQRMPFGLPPLSANQLHQIEDWIAMGADCAGARPVDAAIDAAIDADERTPGDVATVTAAETSVLAGRRTQVTVTLTNGAPGAGQNLQISVADATALGAPATIHLDPGVASATFDVIGKRPAATSLTVAAGTNSKTLPITVTGLALSEILFEPATTEGTSEWVKIANLSDVSIDLGLYSFGSGRASYTNTTAQLTGLIPPHSCFVVGGPDRNAGNGNPTYVQVLDFSPDLLNDSDENGQATGYALFDRKATQLAATSIPLDAVLCGQNNGAGLMGTDGQAATPGCPDVAAAGHSVVRTSSTAWVDQPTPTPADCTQISL
jgi:hypothetical protein